MSDANNMRRYLKLLEAAAPEYRGPKASDTVSYAAEQTNGKVTKIVATLKSYDSTRYTKLGRNLLRIEALTEEIKTLQAETKQEARELVADLFNAEDAACTRVVDTVGFMFHMSKDPEVSGSVSYAKVLNELQAHLTPELITVLETLKAKHTSAPTTRAAALKATDKAAPAKESISEGLGDKLTGFFKKLYQSIKAWGVSYDSKLDSLKAQVGITEDLEESWAEESKKFYAEIANRMKETLNGSFIDAVQAAAITPDEWQQSPISCIHRIRAAQEELYDFNLESIQEDQVSDLQVGDIVHINAPSSQLHNEYGHIEAIEDGRYKVILIGTGYWSMYDANELEKSSSEEALAAYRQPTVAESDECDHEWVEGVDDEGNLEEPAYDVCVNCGEVRY
jgi:hypothetical protein